MSSLFSRTQALLVDVAPPQPIPLTLSLDEPSDSAAPAASTKKLSFHIEIVRDGWGHKEVFDLLHRCYAWRGYSMERTGDHTRDQEITLCAYSSTGAAVGTLTFRLDGPHGLLCDDVYGDCTTEARAIDTTLGEVCKLAIDAGGSGMHVMGELFHSAYLIAADRGVARVFIEVNPRHTAVYRRGLRFEQSGPQRDCERAGAPAVLLSKRTDEFGEHLKTAGSSEPNESSRNIFDYRFSPAEEQLMAARIHAFRPAHRDPASPTEHLTEASDVAA